MLKNVDPITRWLSAEALGNLGKDEAIAPLIIALQDEHIMVQKTAIMALGQIGNDIAIEPLKKFLKNSHSSLRKEAILALEKIYQEIPIPLLLSALNDSESKIRQLTAQKLLSKTAYLGTFPQSLLNGLKHSSITIRIESSKLLGSMTQSDLEDLGIDLVIDALINNFLEDNSLSVRKFAARSLGQIGSQKAIAALISVLQNLNEHSKLRRDTIYALAKIGTEQIFQPITIALKDPSDSIRIAAASVLSRIAGDWAIKDLVASLDDKKWQVRQNSSNALEKIGGAKVEQELLDSINSSELTTLRRRTIFSLLPKVGGKQSFNTLISLLTYPSKSIKNEAATGIGLFTCNRYDMEYINSAIKLLMALVNCSQAPVRDAVVTALGHIAIHHQCREKDRVLIISALETAKNDKNHGVRDSAIDALNKIPSHNVFDSLIQELDSSDIFARKTKAIDGLGRMIHSQTVTKLAKLTLTDGQISLAIEKLKQASQSSNRRISKPAKEILAHIDRSL
ncbi:MAG: HEAT repeat domain-containing protein [Cyanobacteria bacterium P01_A01_bin.83]